MLTCMVIGSLGQPGKLIKNLKIFKVNKKIKQT